MTRIVSTSFETGVLADEVTSIASAAIQTSTPRTGGYYGGAVGIGSFMRISFPNGVLSEFYCGYGFYLVSTQAYQYLEILDIDATVLLRLEHQATGYIKCTINATDLFSTHPFNFDEWHYVEIHEVFSTLFELKVDGVTEITTAVSQTGAGKTNPAAISWGGANTAWYYIDDIVINDTLGADNLSWPGRVKLYPIRPNAPGDVTQLSRGGVDSGNNWDQVDEVPATDTSYVFSDTTDQYDLYNHGTVVLPAGYDIRNVIVVNNAFIDSGIGELTGVVKSGTTEAQGIDHNLSNSRHAYTDAFSVNPDTGLAWTQTDIDGIQGGPKVR